MVRSKVIHGKPKRVGHKLSRWLKKKKIDDKQIVSMTQSSHVLDPGDYHPQPRVVITILYNES